MDSSRFEIRIPSDLRDRLVQVAELEAGVSAARGDFGPILHADRRPFFPEYTDHGIAHVENVLSAAVSLARDESRDRLTPQDAAVLVMSVILHDIAMQVTEDGVAALVSGSTDHQPSRWFASALQERPWPELWKEFRGEAARFSGRQNQRLFGSPEPVPFPDLSDPGALTQRQRLLIGEFLRRHHGRLAHEIAICGFPGPIGAPPITLSSRLGAYRDIAGLVARSHAMSLRPCVDYLRATYGDLRTPRYVHAVFLMGLLRIADYVQVESERAPDQLMRIRALASPVSAGEWRMHNAVVHVHQSGDDPEALTVHAEPTGVDTYLRLKHLLSGIQAELDHTWAVLGEVYGPIPNLHALGLTIRRVRSNLDDESTFAKSVSFIPQHAAFEAADAELLKLLVGPLYGDDPAIGIRELVQNAVDAVRELEEHLKRREVLPQAVPSATARGADDVVVALETDAAGKHWLRVTDRGRGMTVDIIRNYFLRAGASFRMSDAWRSEFEDEKGHARVLRSGRFGIGALAAFLLGEHIEVLTRHAEDKEGIRFAATLDTAPIELVRVPEAPIGTTVRVMLSKAVYTRLKGDTDGWDWYRLRSPSVRRLIERQPVKEVRPGVPPPENTERPWLRLPLDDHRMTVDWTYHTAPLVCCNGITVTKENNRRSLFENGASYYYVGNGAKTAGYWIKAPSLSVFDPDGHFPLSLDRLSLRSKRLPFEEALLQDIARNIVAYAICTAPDTGLERSATPRWYFNGGSVHHGGIVGSPLRLDRRALCWFSTNNGIAPADPSIVNQLAPETLVCWCPSPSDTEFPISVPAVDCAMFQTSPSEGKGDTVNWVRQMLQPEKDWAPGSMMRAQILLGNYWFRRLAVLDRIPMYLRRRINCVEYDGFVAASSKGDAAFNLIPESVATLDESRRSRIRLAEVLYGKDRPRVKPTVLCQCWMHYVGGVIPFDRKRRDELKDRLRSQYPEMGPHLEYWSR